MPGWANAVMVLTALAQSHGSGVCQDNNLPPRTPPPCESASIMFSEAEQTVTLTGDMGCTPSEMADVVPEGALTTVPGLPGVWMLRANVVLREGATLLLHGPRAGGDVEELRLLSTPAGFISIQAAWGAVDIQGTRVTSWDETAGVPDLLHEDGRAFISVRSFLQDEQPRESRMDIRDSDVGYLGHFDDSAYGLAWRVSGTGDSGEDSPVFDEVEVRGVVLSSRIHHNYMGGYMWGASCMEWVGNEVAHNAVYGIDPHDNSDRLLIADNLVHHNGTHGIICSKNCDHLVIRNNTSSFNGRHGIMLHLDVVVSTVEGNRSHDNGGWGIAIFQSHSNVIRGNDLYRNQYGLHVYERSRYNVVEGNVVHDNTDVGIRFSEHASANSVRDNVLFDNALSGLGREESDGQDVGFNQFDRVPGHNHPLDPNIAPRPDAGQADPDE
ncbi:MAG: right-handed parallel beta-helix repeat-containing protein [Myxococcota bacterium]